jgi:hypothetical protein
MRGISGASRLAALVWVTAMAVVIGHPVRSAAGGTVAA